MIKNKRNKSIIFVSHDAMFFGAQLLALSIIKVLSTVFGFNVYTILLNDGELYKKFKKLSKSIICVNKVSSKKLDKWIKNTGAREALINTVISGKIIPILISHNINCVTLVHEMKNIVKQYNAEEALHNIIKHSKKIVFASDYVCKSLNSITSIPKDKIVIHPQGLFNDNLYYDDAANTSIQLRKQYNIKKNTKIVLAMGYGDYRKGVDLFANVCRLVCDKLDDVVFMWVGQLEAAMSQQIQDFVKTNNLDNKLYLVDNQKDHTKYYVAANVFLLTSREDPFPSVVMEAMDAGLPIVCFKEGGGYLDIVNENNGVVVDMENFEQMADSCIDLLLNKKDQIWDSNQIRSYVRANFDFTKYTELLISLLES